MAEITLTDKQVLARLEQLWRQQNDTILAVRRKKKLRDSEKAMWLTELEYNKTALRRACSVLAPLVAEPDSART